MIGRLLSANARAKSKKLLISNRGEIAIRIARAASELGLKTIGITTKDDIDSLHNTKVDEVIMLPTGGAGGYLDAQTIVRIAKETGCDAIHPGYGFLSENAEFASLCQEHGVIFIGPTPDQLKIFGNKTTTRRLAQICQTPIILGTENVVSVSFAQNFYKSLPPNSQMIIKAQAGGGGKGMRIVKSYDEIPSLITRCKNESKAFFNNDEIFLEQYIPQARHIEIQIIGDGKEVIHAYERECSVQRNHQKLIEIAPSPSLNEQIRMKLIAHSLQMAKRVQYQSLGTFEYLVVDTNSNISNNTNVNGVNSHAGISYYFLETNPRLQVEHTVTEAITGLDLVKTQILLGYGSSLRSLGLTSPSSEDSLFSSYSSGNTNRNSLPSVSYAPPSYSSNVPTPKGCAIQTRINMESLEVSGSHINPTVQILPTQGVVTEYEPPSLKEGVRIDGFAYVNYVTNVNYDSLFAKLIVHAATYALCIEKSVDNLLKFKIKGIQTNKNLLLHILKTKEFLNNKIYTNFVDNNLIQIANSIYAMNVPVSSSSSSPLLPSTLSSTSLISSSVQPQQQQLPQPQQQLHQQESQRKVQGHEVLTSPLQTPSTVRLTRNNGGDTSNAITTKNGEINDNHKMNVIQIVSPLQGMVTEITVSKNDTVAAGQQLAIIESMKMEHVIRSPFDGVITDISCHLRDVVKNTNVLFAISPSFSASNNTATTTATTTTTSNKHLMSLAQDPHVDLNNIRKDLREVLDRTEGLMDASRSQAVLKRHKLGYLTARENLNNLCDENTFLEYGGLVIAAQRLRRQFQDLVTNTPADGLVCGIGNVNGKEFQHDISVNTQCIVMSYDYMVLAGTQGIQNHYKKDRMFDIAEKSKLPIILLGEGGGGRPGDTDTSHLAGLNGMAFVLYAKLSGKVPRIGIANGYCFAGNAALIGCSDVIIATESTNLGMGGPAMVEGGGLGVVHPSEIGPMSVQVPNGVVDVLVKNEEEAMVIAKKYLSYFQGSFSTYEIHDQRLLRHAVPENRLRIYDVHQIIEILCDKDSLLELRSEFGKGVVTCFARIEGKPIGIVANNPVYLSGAIDANGSDKAARFMQQCNAFHIPILTLVDTPGIMVGVESEKTANVRHASRLFVTSANLSVPIFSIILRKGYGLGAMAMTGGSFKSTLFTISWPTGEFGGMGLEGAVKLGYKKELNAVVNEQERDDMYKSYVDKLYESGKAINFATAFEIDSVIDPSRSREWIASALKCQNNYTEVIPSHSFVDTW